MTSNVDVKGVTLPKIIGPAIARQVDLFDSRPLLSKQLSDAFSEIARIHLSPARQLNGIMSEMIGIQASELSRKLLGVTSAMDYANQLTLEQPLRDALSGIAHANQLALQRPLLGAISALSTFPCIAVSSRFSTINIAPKTNRKSPIYLNKSRVRSDSEHREAKESAVDSEIRFWLERFDHSITDTGLIRVCRGLFRDGHYAVAVEKACTYLENMVAQKSGCADKYGADLMRTAFSPKRPMLQLNDLKTLSDKNEQEGYMHILEGVMIGIRNPRAHDWELEDGPNEALEMLAWANFLVRKVNGTIRQGQERL